jgi:hypothetical protein
LSKSAFACADVISTKGRSGWGATPATDGAGEAPEPDGFGDAPEPAGAREAPEPDGAGEAPESDGAGEAPDPDGAGEAPDPDGAGFEAGGAPDGGLLVCAWAARSEGIAMPPSPEAAGGLPSQASLRSRPAVAFERAAATTESATIAAVSRQNLTGAPGIRRRRCISRRCSRR